MKRIRSKVELGDSLLSVFLICVPPNQRCPCISCAAACKRSGSPAECGTGLAAAGLALLTAMVAAVRNGLVLLVGCVVSAVDMELGISTMAEGSEAVCVLTAGDEICNLVCSLPGDGTLIPLNVVTSLWGVPVVFYVLMSARRSGGMG